MALSADPWFRKDTDVLRVRSFRATNVRWILLPVFAWRVVAPVPKQRRLNVFQRAVLGLARAGVVEVSRVAARLLIAEDLAALVARELQALRFTNVLGRPTPNGLEALEDTEQIPETQLLVGHVFTHALDGKIWPNFLNGDLPLAEVEPDEKGWPVMHSGSAGDPWRDRAFVILPKDGFGAATQPRPKDIVRASRAHAERQPWLEDGVDAPLVEKVDFIDEAPAPYLLAVVAQREAAGGWYVEDPFNGGQSTDLTERVESLLDRQTGLRHWLAPLVGSDSQDPTTVELQELAQWEVEERLTLGIAHHEALHQRLVAMQRALLEADQPDSPADKWDDVLVKAQKAAERLFREVHDPYVGVQPALFEELDWNVATSRGKVDAIASDIGFPTPLPASLSSVRRGKVQHAERTRRASLRPLLLLSLLAAKWDLRHPLRAAAEVIPTLLVDLDALASARDRAAHEGAGTRPARVKRHIQTVFDAVEALVLNVTRHEGATNGQG